MKNSTLCAEAPNEWGQISQIGPYSMFNIMIDIYKMVKGKV